MYNMVIIEELLKKNAPKGALQVTVFSESPSSYAAKVQHDDAFWTAPD